MEVTKTDDVLKALIEKGKQSGSLTYDEVNAALPELADPDKLPELLELLEQNGISLIDPEAALLFAQAATVGLALAIGAMLLARVSVRPPQVTVPVRGSSRALERDANEFLQRAAGSGSQPSTATNPLLPSPAPESAT